jgi:ketosteroid isomerase-like protein
VSEENVDVARRLLDAIELGDLSCLIELTDSEVEWRSFFAELGEGGEYQGHGGIRQYMSDMAETWEMIHPEADSLLYVGSLVLGVGRIHYKGKESGAESELPAGWIFKFRAGKVVRFWAFRDPEQTLERLSE